MSSSAKKKNMRESNAIGKSSEMLGPKIARPSQAAELHRFGGELYKFREEAGLTQSNLASLAGLTRGYYSQLENSKRMPPPPHTIERLCVTLQLSRSQAAKLRFLANAERCGMVSLPSELPEELRKIMRKLAETAYRLSPAQIHEIYRAVEEAIAM